MQVGDLIAFYPKSGLEREEYIGLLISKKTVGRSKLDRTVLYDVLLTENNELITISDVWFDIWRLI